MCALDTCPIDEHRWIIFSPQQRLIRVLWLKHTFFVILCSHKQKPTAPPFEARYMASWHTICLRWSKKEKKVVDTHVYCDVSFMALSLSGWQK